MSSLQQLTVYLIDGNNIQFTVMEHEVKKALETLSLYNGLYLTDQSGATIWIPRENVHQVAMRDAKLEIVDDTN